MADIVRGERIVGSRKSNSCSAGYFRMPTSPRHRGRSDPAEGLMVILEPRRGDGIQGRIICRKEHSTCYALSS
ncbi:hypothetical protein [Fibrobacter sp.]|uniref:hypothetical protein n=1 Tax=Fibrobacter sp. TaxID=35828 RepID=UPI0026165F87|nr:hypothetical protein [Fibrobacter sp.]MDD5943482.1 hypothetical protein [Fibrobacter sp.]